MAFVILDGTGNYRVEQTLFAPGANECDDEALLEHLRSDPTLPEWITIQEDREPEVLEAPEEPEEEPEPFDVYGGRDGQFYFTDSEGTQIGGFETREEADESADERLEAEKVAAEDEGKIPEAPVEPESEHTPLTLADFDGFPCRAEGCTKVLKSDSGRSNHERIKHPDLTKSG